MKANPSRLATLFFVTVFACLAQVSHGVYFYSQTGKWRCFSDTVVKNNVSEPVVQADTYADAGNGSASDGPDRAAVAG